MRDSEWSVIRYFTPLIGGEPLVEGVKINIFAYYERMHRPILLKIVGNEWSVISCHTLSTLLP